MGIHDFIVNKASRLEGSILRSIDSSRGVSLILYYIFLSSVISCVIIFSLSVFFSIRGVDAGSFGDFVGGTLNPILTFFTVMGLIITIILQQSELKATREELNRSATALENQLSAIDRQNFESTFFQMISIYNSIVNSIDLTTSVSSADGARYVTVKGRDCFSHFFRGYKYYYEDSREVDERSKFQYAYDKFWQVNQQDLSHYYRYLYNFLRFVHEYDGDLDRNKYARIIRSQMSDYELVLLFYTALNVNGIKYCVYIDSYKLFDNLPNDLLINPEHRDLYSKSSFGGSGDAVSSAWPPREYINEINGVKTSITKE